MLYNSKGISIPIGKEIGKGGAATVSLHGSDMSKALKIYKPEILRIETNLTKRIEKLNSLAKVADLDIEFGHIKKPIGAWPKDVVLDRSQKVVGYVMDTVHGGIDFASVVNARQHNTAFYKYRSHQQYNVWRSSFIYHPDCLRNRFIVAYYLSVFFDKIYNLKDRLGRQIDLDICNFDIKPNNILVSLEKIGGQLHIVPYLLDLDNLTLRNKNQTLAPVSPQITPDYQAPEGPIDRYYDYYSIAIIIHQLIFDLHPFMISNSGGKRFSYGTTFDYFRDNKCYPWGRNRKYLDIKLQKDPQWDNFNRVSADLQQLFLRAFDSDLPNQRPTMVEWSVALSNFLINSKKPFNKLFNFS